MTFKDIFKKSFIEGWSGSEIDALSAASVMAITLLLALFIFLIYKITTKKQFYSRGFNISLVGTALITAAIILTVQSNIVISLGMVGALSIVRFRTAIKEPMDLMFLFWSISIGIICGANMYTIAVLASLVITIGLLLLEMTPVGKAASLLVVSAKAADAEKEVLAAVGGFSRVCRVKSRNLSDKGCNLIIECKPGDGAGLITKVKEIEGVYGVSLMAHDGEVTV